MKGNTPCAELTTTLFFTHQPLQTAQLSGEAWARWQVVAQGKSPSSSHSKTREEGPPEPCCVGVWGEQYPFLGPKPSLRFLSEKPEGKTKLLHDDLEKGLQELPASPVHLLRSHHPLSAEPWGSCYYCSHFVDEETEAWEEERSHVSG